MENKQTDIVIYKPKGKAPVLEVHLEKDTVWISQAQMVELFQRDQSVMSRHINNVFKEGELEKESNMHFLYIPNSDRPVAFYNLDVIISVGYRVKSKVGTDFRIWATNVLREYTLKGYALNERRLREAQERLDELTRSIRLIQSVAETRKLSEDETRGLLQVISDYANERKALDTYRNIDVVLDSPRINLLRFEKKLRG